MERHMGEWGKVTFMTTNVATSTLSSMILGLRGLH